MKILLEPCEAEIEVKRSKFIAELYPVKDEDEVKESLFAVKKKHRDARHHCFALRLGTSEAKIYERFSDDGEPQGTAGRPMLDILRGTDLTDTICIVTRYFGGKLLGTGGLVRAYSDSLKEALVVAKTSELKLGTTFSLRSSYDLLNEVRYLAAKSGAFIVGETYDELCTLSFLIDEKKSEAFREKLTSLTLGRYVPEKPKTVLYHGSESPKLYNR